MTSVPCRKLAWCGVAPEAGSLMRTLCWHVCPAVVRSTGVYMITKGHAAAMGILWCPGLVCKSTAKLPYLCEASLGLVCRHKAASATGFVFLL